MPKEENAKRTVTSFLFILCAIALSKVFGLARDSLLADFFGTGTDVQAFMAASRIPSLFFDVTLGGAVSSAFIPVFNEYLEKGSRERAMRFKSAFISLVAIIGAALSLLIALFPRAAVAVVASGYGGELLALTENLVRIIAPVFLIASLAFSYVGVLQSLGEFKIPAAMSLVSNAVMIGYFLTLGNRFGVRGLAVAFTLGWAMQLIILLVPLKKMKVPFRLRPDIKDEGVKKAALLALPMLVSSWLAPINNIVALNVASHLKGGAYAKVEYAYKLYFIVAGLFSTALTNLFFPRLSRESASGDRAKTGATVGDLLSWAVRIVLPVTAFFLIFSKDIVRVVYERGAFSASDTADVAAFLFLYVFAIIAFSFQEILSKSFYALQLSRPPMAVAAVSIGLNVVLCLFFVGVIGAAGIALAATLSTFFTAAALFILLKKRLSIPLSPVRDGLFPLLAAGLSALSMWGAGLLLRSFMSASLLSALLSLAAVFLAGAGIYFLSLLLMGDKPAHALVSLIRDKKR